MDSPSSVSSCSSFPPSSTSPVNSDFGSPSDSEGEDKGAHVPRPDPVRQRGASRPSPGPIRCRHRSKVSSKQHTAPHPAPQGLASMAGSGVKRSRDDERKTQLNIQSCTTEGDMLFAQKCKELQGFIRPLTDLLNGLKMGRFERGRHCRSQGARAKFIPGVMSHDARETFIPECHVPCRGEGLSSFQQSVAMDRIQRIVGVLQKPQIGGRYLGTLLQVEGMLKTWFPHVAAQRSSLGDSRHRLTKHLPSHHTNQAAYSPAPPMEKLDQKQSGHLVLKQKQPWHLTEWPAMNLTWSHTTPICNPPLNTPGTISFNDGPLGTGTSIGVIFLFQHGGQSTHSAPATPVPPTMVSSFISDHPKKLSGEGPRCHSLPVTLTSDWRCCPSPSGIGTIAREVTTRHLEGMSHPPVSSVAHLLNP